LNLWHKNAEKVLWGGLPAYALLPLTVGKWGGIWDRAP